LFEQFEEHLKANRLIELVNKFKSENFSQNKIFYFFEDFRAYLREQNREEDEDAVMDVMDYIVGECHPNARLFEKGLSNEEIKLYREEVLKKGIDEIE